MEENYFDIQKHIEKLEKDLGLKTKLGQKCPEDNFILVARGLSSSGRLVDIWVDEIGSPYTVGFPVSDSEMEDFEENISSIQEAFMIFGEKMEGIRQ